MKFRKEYDSIGSINVPVDKYWGASTQRSKKYFDIGDVLVRPKLIKSIAIIKKSAAIVHRKDKQIDAKITNAIIILTLNIINRALKKGDAIMKALSLIEVKKKASNISIIF